ncbi:MAG: stage VI sporulation protein F [Bacilli bacterium]
MNDNLFNRITEKTNVDKDTIIGLARKLQEGDFKNKDTLREIIHELSDITGKEVSEEKENKIIDMIINDKVPKDLEKYV